MLIRNFKSASDEVAKRNLANELLQVEINNASILDERISKAKNPNAPPPVPPPYKTQSELLKDKIALSKQAIDALLSLGFDYAQASSIEQYIDNNYPDGTDKLVQFVSALPSIKADITKKFNPKLITPEFFKGYLDNFFEDLSVSFGFSFGKDGGVDVGLINELSQILPRRSQVETLLGLLEDALGVDIPIINTEDIHDAITQLRRLFDAIPTAEEEDALNKSTLITAVEKGKIFKEYKKLIKSAQIPAPIEIQQMSDKLASVLGSNNVSTIASVLQQIKMKTSGLTNAKLLPMRKLREEIRGMLGLNEPILQEFVAPEPSAEEPAVSIKSSDVILKDDYKQGIIQTLNNMEEKIRNKSIDRALEGIATRFDKEGISFELERLQPELTQIQGDVTLDEKVKLLAEIMRKVMDIQEENGKMYNPKEKRYLKTTINKTQFGFGLKPSATALKPSVKKLKKHFEEDEKFLKKVASKMSDSDSSSSEEEVLKALAKHKKAEKPYEAKIAKAMHSEKAVKQSSPAVKQSSPAVGAGYIHKRIPVKKIVGKGIEVEEQPTYRTFGKYVMHIPHLIDKNVLNIKYPSLGSIPSIKPMTISDDYKDFIIDVMNTGRPNEKAFNQLNNHEQKHFERITKGAGLIDAFKLKRTGNNEEKEEVDRFNLLRGNYLGGNNSPDVVRELKGLVVKFINDGRIARNEGLNLLMELSI